METHAISASVATRIVELVRAPQENIAGVPFTLAVLGSAAAVSVLNLHALVAGLPFAVSLLVAFAQGLLAVEIYGYCWHRWGEHVGVFSPLVGRAPGMARVQRVHQHHHHIAYHFPKYAEASGKGGGVGYQNSEQFAWTWIVPALPVLAALVWFWGFSALSVAWLLGFASLGWLLGQTHTWLHDSRHFLERWLPEGRRRKIRILHVLHHENVWGNFGILFFALDRLLGTYNGPEKQRAVYLPLRRDLGRLVAFRNAHDLYTWCTNLNAVRAIMGQGGRAAEMLGEVEEVALLGAYPDSERFAAHLRQLRQTFANTR